MKKIIFSFVCILCVFSLGFALKYKGETITAKAEETEIIESTEPTSTEETETKTESETETPTESDKTTDKTDESSKDEQVTEEDKKETLKAFLEFMQTTADEAGIGDEYRKAVEAIKTAASEKQVTISTVMSVAQLAVFVVYIIYLNLKNGKLKKQMVELGEKLDKQLKGTNGLIDESNANGAKTDETQKDVESLKKAMNYLLNGLQTFVERFNIGSASKETVRTQFNKAINEVDGVTETKEVATNEKDKA